MHNEKKKPELLSLCTCMYSPRSIIKIYYVVSKQAMPDLDNVCSYILQIWDIILLWVLNGKSTWHGWIQNGENSIP